MTMLVPVKARALEILEHHARGANRVYAVSKLEMAQAAYGCAVPTRSMLSSMGRALNELTREGALVRLSRGNESLWGVARHAGLLMARRRRLRP
jgi:alkylhydroperoxidase family enzyme